MGPVVVFTGGTIGMRSHGADGVLPAVDGAQLFALARDDPVLAAVAVVDWGSLPSMHLSFEDVLSIAALLTRLQADAETNGIVVVQGTDTIEETCFAFDLLIDARKPIVVTGAMRSLDEPGYDGIDNIRSSLIAAGSPLLGSAGVVAVMNGEIHSAADVAKVGSRGVDAFASPHGGRLGVVEGDAVVLHRRTTPQRPAVHAERFAAPVVIVTAALSGDGFEVPALVAAGAVGIVVAAAGAGQTRPSLLRSCEPAISAGIPVVLASRAAGGAPEPLYGYEGGGIEWQRIGAIFAGRLSPLKARIALSLGLGAGMAMPELRALFEERGLE